MQNNQLRIIAGKWRGRKISFPSRAGLRPTPDRIRETLFNWLAPHIVSANCLDLFTGSGALSFEALSRGAKSVTALEKDALAFQNLQHEANRLKIDDRALRLINIDSLAWLESNRDLSADHGLIFDIVFLDPPFQSNLLFSSMTPLMTSQILSSKALIFIETDLALDTQSLPRALKILKKGQAGKVYFYLAALQN